MFERLNAFISAGDKLPNKVARKALLYFPDRGVFNAYGPTENKGLQHLLSNMKERGRGVRCARQDSGSSHRDCRKEERRYDKMILCWVRSLLAKLLAKLQGGGRGL
jgi:hypothetical protein